MKVKKWPIYIWFLDSDLVKSAKYLTDKALMRSIDGCFGAIVSALLYMAGIRTKKMHSYCFSKERAEETLLEKFPSWPFKKNPSFIAYNRKESKWCRACGENFAYCKAYFAILLDEIAYRTSAEHEKAKFLEWLEFNVPSDLIPYAGLKEIYLPWKAVNPKFRRTDTIAGYRLQFMDSFEDNDPFKAYGSCKRNIPDFVLEHFNSGQLFES